MLKEVLTSIFCSCTSYIIFWYATACYLTIPSKVFRHFTHSRQVATVAFCNVNTSDCILNVVVSNLHGPYIKPCFLSFQKISWQAVPLLAFLKKFDFEWTWFEAVFGRHFKGRPARKYKHISSSIRYQAIFDFWSVLTCLKLIKQKMATLKTSKPYLNLVF